MKSKILITTIIFMMFVVLFTTWKEETGKSLMSTNPFTALIASAIGASTITFINWFFNDYLKRKPKST